MLTHPKLPGGLGVEPPWKEWAGGRDHIRWFALAFIALAQLMLALDATIVNIALPSAQAALKFSDADRQWVITGYTLAFGGLLLLGGRLVDAIGRKRALLIGLLGFALASAASGAAPSPGALVASRAIQGVFAALLAPAALSSIAVTFTEKHDRARAFAVYGAIAGSGGALGLVLGGLLSQYLDWRWCLYVNVPVAIIAAVGIAELLADKHETQRPSLDIPSAILGTLGLALVVESGSLATSQPLAAIGFCALGLAVLTLFTTRQRASSNPLLPLGIVLDRVRGGAYLAVICAIVGMFGAFLLLTYELQVVMRFAPLQAGVAFLPLSAAAMIGSGAIGGRLLPRVGPRLLMVPGFIVAAAGMLVLSQLQLGSDYVTAILPAELLLGLGIGCVMIAATSSATSGVNPREAGAASAVLNTSQQVGASLGTALLNTIAASATATVISASGPEALVHGYAVAAQGGAVVLLLGALLSALLLGRLEN